jgi:pyruvate,water dikinase
VGTGFATARIKTGDLVEVDGNLGIVRILEQAV